MATKNILTGKEYSERLITDLKTAITIKTHTKSQTQIMAEMRINAHTPTKELKQSNEEFAIAMICDIDLPSTITNLLNFINQIEPIFKSPEAGELNFSNFLRDCEMQEEKLSDLIEGTKNKIFVDPSTGQRGNLVYDFIEKQLNEFNREVAVANA